MTILGARLSFSNSEMLPYQYRIDMPNKFVGVYVGQYWTANEFIYLGAQYDYYKYSQGNSTHVVMKGRIFKPFLGLRHYFRPHEKSKVSPFLLAEVFKNYAMFEDNSNDYYPYATTFEQLYSPWGFLLGIGTDYSISSECFLGIEAGLEWSFIELERDLDHYSFDYGKYREIRLLTSLHLDFGW